MPRPNSNQNPYVSPNVESLKIPVQDERNQSLARKLTNLILTFLSAISGLGFCYFALFAVSYLGEFLVGIGCLAVGIGLITAAWQYLQGDSRLGSHAMYMSLATIACTIAIRILFSS